MIRAVLDANVVISAMLAPNGTPGQVARRVQSAFTLVWSTEIVAECIRVAGYGRLRSRFQVADPEGFLAWLVDRGEVVYAETIETVVDVDRASDVALAESLAREWRIT